MNQEIQQIDRIAGYPAFVSHDNDGVNWWNPARTGNADIDYFAGRDHLDAALVAVTRCDTGEVDFEKAILGPLAGHPAVILGWILGAMTELGPMEHGFLDRLAEKALVGRLPLLVSDLNGEPLPSAFRKGEAAAQATMMLARISSDGETIVERLVLALKLKSESYGALAFIWTACSAATSGALH